MGLLPRRSLARPAVPESASAASTAGSSDSPSPNSSRSPVTCTTSQVDHPSHYNQSGSGIECIDVVEWLPFNVGNAIKYLWRADHKGKDIEDLQKALWYVQREIQRRSRHDHQ
jgi:hypothetical protein